MSPPAAKRRSALMGIPRHAFLNYVQGRVGKDHLLTEADKDSCSCGGHGSRRVPARPFCAANRTIKLATGNRHVLWIYQPQQREVRGFRSPKSKLPAVEAQLLHLHGILRAFYW